MSKIILSDEALSAIIKQVVSKVEGVSSLSSENPVEFTYTDSSIEIKLKVIALFGYNLVELAKKIEEAIKLEIENITPVKVKDVSIEFEDIVYGS